MSYDLITPAPWVYQFNRGLDTTFSPGSRVCASETPADGSTLLTGFIQITGKRITYTRKRGDDPLHYIRRDSGTLWNEFRHPSQAAGRTPGNDHHVLGRLPNFTVAVFTPQTSLL